ncbi:hypothetical protein [Streptomyces sp. NPDC127066]|uniref:hypothetical protein n=1 Tax=Streptomyces sp. NPDC127066 TaxID=3347125 RepID=UPI003655B7BF
MRQAELFRQPVLGSGRARSVQVSIIEDRAVFSASVVGVSFQTDLMWVQSLA